VRTFAVVLTGPPGVGKTSVLTALADMLSDGDVPHAAVEVEMLAWTHPALSEEQWMHHVRTTCALHRDAGHRLLLVAQTLETDDDRIQLVDAVGADEHFLVRLEAWPQTLVRRIVDREPAGWSGLGELVDRAQDLAASMPSLTGVDLALSTEGEAAETVAERIRAALPQELIAAAGGR
jgi:hypothetical protein